MSRQVDWADRALKDMSRLDRRARERVFDAVRRMADTGFGDIKRLQATDEEVFRLRVGELRVLFSRQASAAITIRRVKPRGGAYQD